MATFLLLHAPLPASGPWAVLLQQQAAVAAARAVLAGSSEGVPTWSGNTLLAPRSIELLPLLALAARDFAEFAEPEAPERPAPPITLYEDEPWPPGDAGEPEEMGHLLHPAWFADTGWRLSEAVVRTSPDICISVASARRTRDLLTDISGHFKRVVYFDVLSRVEGGPIRDLPSNFVAADSELARQVGERTAPVETMWLSLLAEGEAPDLEPFTAFGPAIEMAIWGVGDRR